MIQFSPVAILVFIRGILDSVRFVNNCHETILRPLGFCCACACAGGKRKLQSFTKVVSMEAQRALNEHVFRKFTRLERDRKCYIVDVRPYKEWKRHHILLSFCCRLSSNGAALSDCSKNRYDQKWVQVCPLLCMSPVSCFLGCRMSVCCLSSK